MLGSQHDASVSSQIERELVAFRQPRLFDNRLRNPYRQTVTPFRQLRFILHMDLH